MKRKKIWQSGMWQNLYASAFVTEFNEMAVQVGFDRAEAQSECFAERAETVADIGVRAFRAWNRGCK